jgi:hypothetical protein
MVKAFGLTEYLHFLQRPESHGNKAAVTEFPFSLLLSQNSKTSPTMTTRWTVLTVD